MFYYNLSRLLMYVMCVCCVFENQKKKIKIHNKTQKRFYLYLNCAIHFLDHNCIWERETPIDSWLVLKTWLNIYLRTHWHVLSFRCCVCLNAVTRRTKTSDNQPGSRRSKTIRRNLPRPGLPSALVLLSASLKVRHLPISLNEKIYISFKIKMRKTH